MSIKQFTNPTFISVVFTLFRVHTPGHAVPAMLAGVRLPLAPQQRHERLARGRHRVGHLKRDAEHGGAAGARARACHVANVHRTKRVAEPCRAKRRNYGLAEAGILRQQHHAHAPLMRGPPAAARVVGRADVNVHCSVVARVRAFYRALTRLARPRV